MSTNTYSLTGITGLLGRNVFFEIIKDNLNNLNNIEFILFGRASNKESLKKRVKNIFQKEGLNYLSIDANKTTEFDWFFERNITYINIDLASPVIISESEQEKLSGKSINHFYHIAASTDFRNDEKTKAKLNQQNVEGTKKILELCSLLKIEEFSYVSSAYACGLSFGDIQPNYVNMNQEFRNHYEKTKLQGELLVKEYEKNTGVRCRIFRPSTISGRLLEHRKGEIYKFDVFYAWGAFFLKWKLKQVKNIDKVYDKKVDLDVRIAINLHAGLNIVPVDFAAKIMYQVCKQNIEGQYFHLVNEKETPHSFLLGKMLETLNLSGHEFIDHIPTDFNILEKFYYKTVGSIFSPYTLQNETNFNTDNLKELYEEQNLSCPIVDQENLLTLLDYAKSENFGLRV